MSAPHWCPDCNHLPRRKDGGEWRRNDHPGSCSVCGAWVAAGEGTPHKKPGGGWGVYHFHCPRAST